MKKVTKTTWTTNTDEDFVDIGDTEEPIIYWWNDTNPREFYKLIKDAYAREYKHRQKNFKDI